MLANFKPSMLAGLTLLALSTAASASVCGIDRSRLNEAIKGSESSYGDVAPDVDCNAPNGPGQMLLCLTAAGDAEFADMVRLADRAFVYAYENATGMEQNHANPPRHDLYQAARDACTDVACLCAAMIEETNDAYSISSPYWTDPLAK